MIRLTALLLALVTASSSTAAAAVTVVGPEGGREVFSRGDLYDILAILTLTGTETTFARAAGSYTARSAEHEVQFTPGGSLAVIDGRLTALPGPVRNVEGHILATIETVNAILTPFAWRLRGEGDRLELVQAPAGIETIVVSQVHAAEGTLVVLRGCAERPQLSSRPGELVVRFSRPVELASPVTAEGALLGGQLVGRDLTLRLSPGLEVAASYVLDDPPRFVVRLSSGSETAPLQERGSGPLVVLDPGHGGEDWGARGPAGELEKTITLAIARMTAAQLQARGIAARLTRDSDAAVPLQDRTALANRLKASAFLSIHANASPARAAQGAETFFMSAEPSDVQAAEAAAEENAATPPDTVQLILWDLAQVANLNESARLARTIQENLNLLHGTRDRGIKQAPFLVLTGATMPAALVEVGFLSNPEEAAKLTERSTQEAIASALADATAAFLRAAPPATPSP